jgi:predicted O-methyltransferase YrrM/DNA-binding MarR family transcriptional regulator
MTTTWTPQAVLDLARSYQPMCVLAAGVELDVFALLSASPLSAGEMAQRLGADARATTILLDALAGLGLLEKRQDRYSPAPGTTAVLTDAGQQSVRAMVLHQANCLRHWSELAEVVKTGRPSSRGPSIRGADADYAAFIEAMDNLARTTAGAVVSELPRVSFRHLLDVGGASGSWTIAFLRAYPEARATLFDLPKVIPHARQRLEAAGLLDRVRLVAGDYNADALPGGADLAWISAIVHQNSRDENRAMFQKVHAALEPGGRVLIRDVLMDPGRTTPVSGALFAVNMLVNTPGGGTYTVSELREDLASAGLVNPQVVRQDPAMNAVLAAERP